MDKQINFYDNEEIVANSGGYFVLGKDGSVKFSNTEPTNVKIIDKTYVENLLYRCSLHALQVFSKTNQNKDVYVCSLYVCTDYASTILYLNNLSELKATQEHYLKKYPDCNITDLIYAVGDFEINLENDMSPEADWFTSIYRALTWGEEFEVQEDVAVRNEIFYENIIQIGLLAAERIETETKILNKTDDFIMYYSDHDVNHFYNKHYEERYIETKSHLKNPKEDER